MASKIKKACDISPAVRREVIDRDKVCIICGRRGEEIAHYISRARLGLGIPQNLGYLCQICHFNYDNGKLHKEIKNLFKAYLQEYYDNWDENKLTYRKWNNDTETIDN